MSDTPISPITFEVVRHRLTNINEDAAATLKRVSGSQIAVEANDLNTVIMAPDGRVVACGRYVLVQVASMHLVVTDLLEHYLDNPGIDPGDQFITNDPYVGTLHQPDVVLAAPVFYGGELVAWCASSGAPVRCRRPDARRHHLRRPLDLRRGHPDGADEDRRRRAGPQGHRAGVPDPVADPELNALDLAGQIAANREAVAPGHRPLRALRDRDPPSRTGPAAVVERESAPGTVAIPSPTGRGAMSPTSCTTIATPPPPSRTRATTSGWP